MSALHHDPLTLAQAARIMREANAFLPPKIAQAANGCWLWTAATDADGYGRFGVGGRNSLAHRVSLTRTMADVLAEDDDE